MSTFVQRAACRGHRPAEAAALRHQSRPQVVAQLLREREVARCLVAPTGFGKSTLAYEYAEVMFDFNHVFWIGATSPCFLRDLDAGTLFGSLVEADERCALVVFEDVPLLEGERLAQFSEVIDKLLERGCEVLVTTTPSRDCLGPWQRDRLLIDGADLMLDDEEAARNGRGEPTGRRPPFAAEERIACVQWGDDGWSTLLAGCAAEELPADMLLVQWLVLAQARGTWHEVAALLGEPRALEAWGYLAPRYPFLGMSEADGTFSAVRAEPAVLATRFDRIMDGVVASETSNNAVIGGALIPLLTLGIPGDGVTAMLLGAFMIHGLTPGPLLFVESADLIYTIFIACILANVVMLVLELGGMRIFVRLLSIPKYILLPVVLVLCTVGAFATNNRIFDAQSIVIFGVLGYLMSKFKLPVAPFILSFILCDLLETNLRRGLMLTQNDFLAFFTHPIAAVFMVAAVLFVVWTVIKQVRNRKKETAGAA